MQLDVLGKRFNNVILFGIISAGGRARGICQCDCGSVFIAVLYNILSNNTKSCGCRWKNEKISYNPDTGEFSHPIKGVIMPKIYAPGYPRYWVGNKCYTGHQLAFKLMGVVVPKGMQIDHINRDKTDNRWCNLRIVTVSENQYNRECCKRFDVKLYFHKKRNRYMVVCIDYMEHRGRKNPKRTSLGFSSKEEAEKYRNIKIAEAKARGLI